VSIERDIFELDDRIIENPINHKDISIELNYDLNDPHAEATVTTTVWELEGEGANMVNERFDSGITGGVGVGEGMPFKYSIQDDNSKVLVLDAFLNLASSEATYECDKVSVPSKIRGGTDWLEESADTAEYNIIFSKGLITTNDWVQVPYAISTIPNNQDIAMLTISAFILGIEIVRSIKESGYLGAELAGFFTTIPAIVKLILFIIYLVILIISLFKLINDLIRAIIQPTKFHNGMKLITLLEKGAEFLGMGFYSSIFENDEDWKNVVILPAKYRSFRDPKEKDLFGAFSPNNSKGYYNGSFGGLLRAMITFFNAKINIIDNVVTLERVDTNPSQVNYKLPPVEQKVKSHNFNEWNKTYNLRFVIDGSESNTVDNYEGTVTNVVPGAPVVNNKDMTGYGGAPIEKVIEFARGTRKTELTVPEAFFDTILKAFGPAVNQFEKVLIPQVKSQIPSSGVIDYFSSRIGMLVLEKDYFTTNKLIMYDIGNSPADNKVSLNNEVKVNTSYLYDNFHYVNSGVPTLDRPNANQWLRYETARVNFCKDDFLLVRNNNIIFDTMGREAKIETLKWNRFKGIAEITYRVNQLFLDVIESKDTPDGE
jgi:hypothetical protein